MYRHILVPVAPGHYGEYERAFSVARKLVKEYGTISVLTVLQDLPVYFDSFIPEDLLDRNMAEASANLRAEFGTDGVEHHVVAGHPANAILDWADSNRVDCVVILSHRPGLSDYFIGSTAARVVRHAQCPVHVLR